jgi:hypothetical protein
MSNGLALVELESGRVAQFCIDHPKKPAADPAGVAVTRDGRQALISIAGQDLVARVDLAALLSRLEPPEDERQPDPANNTEAPLHYVAGFIKVGALPGEISVSADGRQAYVADRLADQLTVLDLERGEAVGELDLGGPRHVTVLRKGEAQFNQAGEFSCRGCHPRGGTTGLVYDFEADGLGRGLADAKTLNGIRDTSPFKWTGTNRSEYMQCGIRFEHFVSRVIGFTFQETVALVAYVQSLEVAHNRRAVRSSPATERGRAIFERTRHADGREIAPANRCGTCHAGPSYTDRKVHDVGTRGPSDNTAAFDVPQLRGVVDTAPYLHDGRALSLEELWLQHNTGDRHGVTSDLEPEQVEDLCRFLETL